MVTKADSLVATVPSLRTVRYKRYFYAPKVQTGAHPASYSVDTGPPFPGVKRPDVKLITKTYLVSRLRINEAIVYLFSLYVATRISSPLLLKNILYHTFVMAL